MKDRITWDQVLFVAIVTLATSLPTFLSAQTLGNTDQQISAVRLCAAPAASPTGAKSAMRITKQDFGHLPDGRQIDLYTCVNRNGLVMKVATYGATVVALETPDRHGKLANITGGFDSLKGYLGEYPYFGATVGRYANRIAKGRFTLDGKDYQLATNDGPNHLHGGIVGLNRVVWNAKPVQTDDSVGVEFTYRSPDGEEGYPGNLDITVVYALTNSDEMKIDYSAKTDHATVINLTNHCYWNLGGAGTGTILNHVLMLNADKYLPVDATLIPTGALASVVGTPFDFREAHSIGKWIEIVTGDPPGYDHCFVLRHNADPMTLAARVHDPDSGRTMEISTTQPAIQFYTGNFLDGTPDNAGYQRHDAFCIETQHYPDSPNHSEFPSVVLQPGETYHQVTVHRFSVK